MKWQVVLKLVGPDGTVGVHEVGGRATVAEYAPRMIGLTLEEGKRQLCAMLHGLVAKRSAWTGCETPATPVTILSDGADGSRSLGKPPALVQLSICWTGSISRCGFSTPP
jgi:hypothetical protein